MDRLVCAQGAWNLSGVAKTYQQDIFPTPRRDCNNLRAYSSGDEEDEECPAQVP